MHLPSTQTQSPPLLGLELFSLWGFSDPLTEWNDFTLELQCQAAVSDTLGMGYFIYLIKNSFRWISQSYNIKLIKADWCHKKIMFKTNIPYETTCSEPWKCLPHDLISVPYLTSIPHHTRLQVILVLHFTTKPLLSFWKSKHFNWYLWQQIPDV